MTTATRGPHPASKPTSRTPRPTMRGTAPCTFMPKWINQTIRLVGCPRHFGGLQWYFVCPAQGRYVSVLWSLPGQRFFVGRQSLGKQVAYLSQYHSPGARAHYSADKLCNRIGGAGASDEWDVPPKPKWMRWRTYERLSNRIEKHRSEAGVLPRLFLPDGERGLGHCNSKKMNRNMLADFTDIWPCGCYAS